MTFYQELQLNQAGSKNLLKKSETTKEKMYHIRARRSRRSYRRKLHCCAYYKVYFSLR